MLKGRAIGRWALAIAAGCAVGWYLLLVLRARLTADVLLVGGSRALSVLGFLVVVGWLVPRRGRWRGAALPREAGAGRVIVTEPGRPGRVVWLHAGETIVGTAPGCDLVVEDHQVAARHVALRVDAAGRLAARDLGSREGSRLGEARLGGEWTGLRPGVAVTVGRTRIEGGRPS